MTLVAVESIPKRVTVPHKHDTDAILDVFADSSAKIVKVTFGPTEFVNAHSMYSSLSKNITAQKRRMKIRMVNGEVYLEKII